MPTANARSGQPLRFRPEGRFHLGGSRSIHPRGSRSIWHYSAPLFRLRRAGRTDWRDRSERAASGGSTHRRRSPCLPSGPPSTAPAKRTPPPTRSISGRSTGAPRRNCCDCRRRSHSWSRNLESTRQSPHSLPFAPCVLSHRSIPVGPLHGSSGRRFRYKCTIDAGGSGSQPVVSGS
jgi:hypothetical protein